MDVHYIVNGRHGVRGMPVLEEKQTPVPTGSTDGQYLRLGFFVFLCNSADIGEVGNDLLRVLCLTGTGLAADGRTLTVRSVNLNVYCLVIIGRGQRKIAICAKSSDYFVGQRGWRRGRALTFVW